MKRLEVTIQDIATIYDRAQSALLSASFDEAAELSRELARTLQMCRLSPVLAGDARPRPYSVLVLAHRAVPAHADLIGLLERLDPARYEVILVENSSEPVFDLRPGMEGSNWTVLRLGRNLGVGVGRSLGFLAATGRGVICIDDDGLTTTRAIESLVQTFEAYRATAVRGRVLPRTPGTQVPSHYDLGDSVIRRYCDIEGMAIWNRRDVLRVGGFDPILYGHEGAELSTCLYAFHGPEAFLYDPKALLWHDYSDSPEKAEEKRRRYELLNAYLRHSNPDYERIKLVFQRPATDAASDALIQSRFSYAQAAPSSDPKPTVSILATCWNGVSFLESFVASLERQTDRAFELVFVDDGSEDGSAEALQRLWPSDIPLRLLRSDRVGRAAALNIAIAEATGDICLIADVDDRSLPERVEWTREAYRRHPGADMIGFMIFDTNSHARAARPFPVDTVPLEVRCLFGMPCPFPAFSFRRSRLRQGFDPGLTAGIDCDWLFRSILDDGARGVFVPLNLTYYHTHAEQITASKRDLQRSMSLAQVRRCHETVLGPDGIDDEVLRLFTGWEPVTTGPDYWRVHAYGMKLIRAIGMTRPDLSDARHEMVRHLDSMHMALLRSDHARSKALGEKLAVARKEAEAQAKALQADLDAGQVRHREELARLEKASRDATAQVAELQRRLDAARDQGNLAQFRLFQLKDEIERKARHEARELKTAREKLEAERGRRASAETRLKQLESDLRKARALASEARQATRRAEEDAMEVRRKLNRTLSSRTWRLTAPIRAAIGWTRGRQRV
jgi:glycosyltransferase involved in cell wall biosynthesis/predicted  nucleic acid-binding Zn-ribbon protein